MSTITPLATHRNESAYPFCPGCGHGFILDHLNEALVKQELDPRECVIVSDIGCSGLSDQYFVTSAFHGLHGRSVTYATGIKLMRPDLKVVVIMGDGGCGIGGAHLLAAARRNIGLTLIVMNNFNFGMTGGQHSVTTPTGARTATTPGGNLERPLDICKTVAVNGAGFVYRGTNFDKDLSDTIAKAMKSECFAVLDVWDLCTAYFQPANKFGKSSLEGTMEVLGLETGLIRHDEEAVEFAAGYREACAEHAGKPTMSSKVVEPQFQAKVDDRFSIVVAGSAGGKVRSAVKLVAQAAMLCDLWVTQRDDYPITVKSGHSVSEVIFGPEEIEFTGIQHPKVLVILTADGLKKSSHYLGRMDSSCRVFVTPEFADLETEAQLTVLDPSRSSHRVTALNLGLFCVAATLESSGVLPMEAFEAAARAGRAAFVEGNLATINAAREFVSAQ